MIKPALLLALLAHLALVSAAISVGRFLVDYAPNSQFDTRYAGEIDQSEESTAPTAGPVVRSQYYKQPYNMGHGEYPSYQLRIRTQGTINTTNLWIYGNFTFGYPSWSCKVANYAAPRTGRKFSVALSGLTDSQYSCSLYQAQNGFGPGYLYFSSIAPNTWTIINITSSVPVPCEATEGYYGTLSFNAKSDQVPGGQPYSEIKTYVIHNYTAGCPCPPGQAHQDSPYGCGTDQTVWLNTTQYYLCDDPTTPYGLYYRLKLGAFYYSGLNVTIPYLPNNNGGFGRTPNSVLSSSYNSDVDFDTFIPNVSAGNMIVLRTNSTSPRPQGTTSTFALFFGGRHDCIINSWSVGPIYNYPGTVYANAPAYGSLNGGAGLNSGGYAGGVSFTGTYSSAKKRSLTVAAPAPVTVCASTVDVQQSMISSQRENGVVTSRWSVNVSTTTESLYNLELSIRSIEESTSILEYFGVSKVRSSVFHVEDNRLPQGVAPHTPLREIEYIIEGDQPADILVTRAACDQRCSSSAYFRRAAKSEDVEANVVYYDYVLHVINEGQRQTDSVTFEVTVADASHHVELMDSRFSHKVVDGLTTKFTAKPKVFSTELGLIPFVVTASYKDVSSYVDPDVTRLTTKCA